MAQHKSRKELRQELAAVTSQVAELETLKTPEGLASYLFSKRGDDDFEEKLNSCMHDLHRAEQERLEAEEVAQAEATVQTQAQTSADATG